MKKKLEAELISIAHRVLKLKNKSELVQLHQEAQKLYEKLSVLRFVEENFADVKPTIGYKEVEGKLEQAFEEEEVLVEETPSNEEVAVENTKEETPEEKVSEVEQQAVQESEIEEETEETAAVETEDVPEIATAEEDETGEGSTGIAEEPNPEEEVSEAEQEAVAESEKEEEPTAFERKEETPVEEEEKEVPAEDKKDDLFVPTFELAFDKKDEVQEVAKETGNQIIFEDFLGADFKELEFVKAEIEKKEENPEPVNPTVVPEIEETKDEATPKPIERAIPEIPQYDGPKITKGITFGLNDKVGFVSQLFGGSNEDFNRVISQLNTFNTFQDAKNFIEDLVKPDYNDWKGKEDFETRFLEVVENKFK